MSNHHTASPEQWAYAETCAPEDFAGYSCILELRARIEALEVGQQPPRDKLDRLIALDRDDSTEAAAQRGQPMTTVYRALCAELVDIATAHCNPDDSAVGHCAAVLTRARAELAKPEPVAPTDGALANFSDWFCRNYPGPDTIIHKPQWHAPKVFRAAADAIARYGTPANALPTPEATND
jgi:hypothetical protein